MAEIRINATGGVKLYDADDSHYAQIIAGTITSNTDVMTLGHAAVVMGTKLDMNGSNLVLDADADTYLDTGTDDTIKFYVSGAHDLTIGANAINVLSGTTLTIDSGATITNSGTANGFGSADPSSADGDTLGTASAEWSDLYLADGGIVYFGNDQEITLTHSADSGLLLKHTATADDKPINLVLQTGETDMAADDVIGKISFQAPDEGTGTDAILVSAAVQAVAEGNHSSSSNATRLEFMTGSSEAATSQMTVSSGGIVGVGAGVPGDLGVGIHIKTADSGQGSPDGNCDELILENSGGCGLTILSGTANLGRIAFGDSGHAMNGRLQYDHNADSLDFFTSATEKMMIDTDGKVGIGVTSMTHKLQVAGEFTGTTNAVALFQNTHSSIVEDDEIMRIQFSGDGDASGGHFINFYDSVGDIGRINCASTSSVAYVTSSDYRLKENVVDITTPITKLKALKPKSFNFIRSPSMTQDGFLAHELAEVVPIAVSGQKDAMKTEEYIVTPEVLNDEGSVITEAVKGEREVIASQGVDTSFIVPLLVGALQEAITKIETLEAKVAVLEG